MNDWKTVRLGDVATYINGYAFKPSDWGTTGLPIIRIQNLTGNDYETNFFNGEIHPKYTVKDGDVLISWSASLGVYEWNKGKALLNQHIFKVVFDKIEVDKKYFIFTVSHLLNEMAKHTHGSTMRHITKPDFDNMPFPLPSIKEQKKISELLEKCTSIIATNKQMLEKYDMLIKSRFIEMFGDPVTNERNWEKVRLDSVADIKIGPFGSLLHQEDYITGGHALVNPSHIIDGRICTDEKLTISDEKYTELTPYHLQKHDVVMGRRGEMGRCAVVDSDGLLCGTGSLIIRTKGELKSDFIQKIISFPSYKKTIEDKAVGQTMPNLNVPIVSSFEIIKPPKEVQDNYYAFVQQIDKSKFAVQKSLEKAETLYKSLMQEYFG